MRKMISGIYLNKDIATVSLMKEILSDGSIVYDITIGENSIKCISPEAAVESYYEIVTVLRNATNREIFVS